MNHLRFDHPVPPRPQPRGPGPDEPRHPAPGEVLNAILARVYVLHAMTRKAWWDLADTTRRSLDPGWAEQQLGLEESVDELSARVGALGYTPVATMTGTTEDLAVREALGAVLNATQSLDALVAAREALLTTLRARLTRNAPALDADTREVLARLLARHERDLRALRGLVTPGPTASSPAPFPPADRARSRP